MSKKQATGSWMDATMETETGDVKTTSPSVRRAATEAALRLWQRAMRAAGKARRLLMAASLAAGGLAGPGAAQAEMTELHIVERDGQRWVIDSASETELGPFPTHGALEIWFGAEDDAPGTERWTAIECHDEWCAGVR